MAGLSLSTVTGASPRASLRKAIADCKQEGASIQHSRLFAASTSHEGKSSKQLLRRLSSTFGDNTIHRLNQVPGHPFREVHE